MPQILCGYGWTKCQGNWGIPKSGSQEPENANYRRQVSFWTVCRETFLCRSGWESAPQPHRIIRSSHHRCTGFKPVFPGSFNGNTSGNFRVPTCPFLLVPQFFRVLLTLWSRCHIKTHYHCSFNNYRSILSGILSLCPWSPSLYNNRWGFRASPPP